MNKNTSIFIIIFVVIIASVAGWAWLRQSDSETAGDQQPAMTIDYPKGGEFLIAGETYTLKWIGGSDPIQVFLIDTSLKLAGASVAIADRVYGIKNTGNYAYLIPVTMQPGIYEFQIGGSTSNSFHIVAPSEK